RVVPRVVDKGHHALDDGRGDPEVAAGDVLGKVLWRDGELVRLAVLIVVLPRKRLCRARGRAEQQCHDLLDLAHHGDLDGTEQGRGRGLIAPRKGPQTQRVLTQLVDDGRV